jgi:uncharacterized protein
MNLSELLQRERARILDLARVHGADEVRVFGSVGSGTETTASDLDLLVRMQPGRTLLDMGGLASDLEALLGRRVDVVSEGGLRGEIGERIRKTARPI